MSKLCDTMQSVLRFQTLLLFAILFSLSAIAEESSGERYPGLRDQLKLGRELVRKLSSLTPKQLDQFDVTTYRDEVVTFIGGVAPPGTTNDLLTEGGYYLRVVNPENKDLRPHSVWWEVSVKGKILQVFPRHKLIVIEVQAKDWHVLQTG